MRNPTVYNRDYKPAERPKRPGLRRHHVHALAVVSAVIGLAALLNPSHEASATRDAAKEAQARAALLTETLPIPDAEIAIPELSAEAADALPWNTVTVKKGDTLSGIFKRLGLSAGELQVLLQSDKSTRRLARLRPGETLLVQKDDQQLKALHYNIDEAKTLVVSRDGNGFTTELVDHPIETRVTFAAGTISSSLYAAGQQAGLSDRLIMELIGIFGWDIDFALDIREGDSFSLVYEEIYRDGEKLRNGAIVAAEFVNQGRRVQAVRFTDPQGHNAYFDPEGHSMRKAFLRSPVDFRRISSRFQRERYHPVLGKKRPHRGVDYAASVGTPIKAAGDGKIVYRGWKGGYGRTIVIQHGGRYSTLYAHMSRYRPGLKSGSRVKQGQIIGYVGKSGLATGPHLHYEFRVDGVHRNPLTVRLPNADPIDKRYKAAFQAQASVLLNQLKLFSETQLAANEP